MTFFNCKRVWWSSTALLCLAMTGCAGGTGQDAAETGSDTAAVVPETNLKSTFQSIAENGYVGSGLPGIKPTVEALNNDAITKEFEKLEAADQAGDQAKVRASAKRILQLLK
ncbi:hypothetical protein GC176_11180 [bacterium]|nr:hypothetical protein [bacterium]